MHWQGWRQGEKQGAQGGDRESPLVAATKLGAGGQLSSVCIWGILFNFLCLFILLRRVCTKWPHPEFCAWGFAYFICPLVRKDLWKLTTQGSFATEN